MTMAVHRWLRCGVFLLLLALVAACSRGESGASGSTTVTIALSSTPTAVGVLSKTPPNNITSFLVEALQGGTVVASASALPNTTVRMTLVNGTYTFRLTAYDAAKTPLYRGNATAQLTGIPIPLSITLSGYIAVTADHTSVNPGDVVHFSAQFMNAAPTSANPLVWSATGGVVSVQDTYGASATWTAPQQGGRFTVTAKVNTAVSPDQAANGSGDTVITVVDLPPLVIPKSLRYGVAGVPGVGLSPQLSATGWAAIQSWASGTRVVDDIDGIKTLPAATLAASYPIGDTQIPWSSTDSGGNTTTVQAVLHLYAPSTTTFKAADGAGNPLAGVRVSGVALSSYSAVPLLDKNSNSKTDAAGQLVSSIIDPAENYLIAFATADSYADGFWTTGNVVSSYQNALLLTTQNQNTTITVTMKGGAGRIAGQVKDGAGAAIAYARVDIAPKPYSDRGAHLATVADSKGNFSANVPPGDYYVLATGTTIDPAVGIEHALSTKLVGDFYTTTNAAVSPYASAAGLVRVSAGTTQAVYMQLTSGGLVAGRVTTVGGAPVVNMRVNIEPYGVNGARTYEAVTDLNGVYQLNVPPGEYRVAATNLLFDPTIHGERVLAGGWVGGYVTDGSGALTLTASSALIHPLALGSQRVVNLTLQRGGTIQGQVTGAGGARVRIFARDTTSGAVQRVFADTGGNYAVNMLPGTVQLVVDSYAADSFSGQLQALPGGVAGGYVDALGVAQSVAGNAKAITLSAGQTVTQNIQLNVAPFFDAAAKVGGFIP